jgi:acyl carrier protein
MTQAEFLEEIDAITQADPGTTSLEDRLADLKSWDSMAVIMFIAMTDEKLGISLKINMLASAESVGDLARLCGWEGGDSVSLPNSGIAGSVAVAGA